MDKDHPVAADPEMPVGELFHQFPLVLPRETLPGSVDVDIIIAAAMHLGEIHSPLLYFPSFYYRSRISVKFRLPLRVGSLAVHLRSGVEQERASCYDNPYGSKGIQKGTGASDGGI